MSSFSFRLDLSNACMNQTFSDLRVICGTDVEEQETLFAHKVVLCSAFTALEKCLSDTDGSIHLNHPAKIIKALLTLVYTGLSIIDQEDLEAFKDTAQVLGLQGYTDGTQADDSKDGVLSSGSKKRKVLDLSLPVKIQEIPRFVHMKSGKIQCSKCSREFAKMAYATTHYKEQHEKPTELFGCSFEGCDKKFGVKRHLSMHILSAHKVSTSRVRKESKGSAEPSPSKKSTKARVKKEATLEATPEASLEAQVKKEKDEDDATVAQEAAGIEISYENDNVEAAVNEPEVSENLEAVATSTPKGQKKPKRKSTRAIK